MLLVACVAAAAASGCKPKELTVSPPAIAGETPTIQALIAAQNDRAARLATTYSDGVIELHWRDRDGDHTDQGDLELWQTTGNRVAARISKLGEDLFWLGSNGDQWWLFDLRSKGDRVLHRGTHDQQAEPLVGLGVRPLSLLDLLGITALTAEAADLAKPPVLDAARRAWAVSAAGRGGRVHACLHEGDFTPVRVELLDDAGRVIAASVLTRYESVPVPDTAIMARPKMPRTIDIHFDATDDRDFEGDVKIALNQTDGAIDDKQAARIFDLERLIAALRPDRVEQAGRAP